MNDSSKRGIAPVKTQAVPSGASLPWREFFVRLGDGTLQSESAPSRDRDATLGVRAAKARQAEPAFR